MADDHIHIESSFNQLEAAVQRAVRTLEEQFASFKAQGDEVRAKQVQMQIAEIQGPTRAPAISEATAAQRRLNAEAERGAAIEVETVGALREQTAARMEQAAITARLQAASGFRERVGLAPGPQARLEQAAASARMKAAGGSGLVLSGTGGGAGGATAGQQLAAEERAAVRIAAAEKLQAEQLARQLAERDALAAATQRTLAFEQAQAAEEVAISNALRQRSTQMYAAGREAGALGTRTRGDIAGGIAAVPSGVTAAKWELASKEALSYNRVLGEYDGLATRAALSTQALEAKTLQLGMAQAEASNKLRAHGALTTEYLGALARGETTINEFGYQLGATIGKFAGWVSAAALTYGALGAIVEFGKGAIDTSNAVGKLRRTIDEVNPQKATAGLEQLSKETNVSMQEAGDTVFQFSRTFHNLDDAIAAARLGLSALKLDNVDLATSVRLQTQIHQQYGYNLTQLGSVYDMLASGQAHWNARISDNTAVLQKSTGAVKNARGDLTQLIQLSEYATRITQLGGAQVGTAFYRSAATQAYTPAHEATIKGYGINVAQGWTQMMLEALQKGASLGGDDRRKLANAIFGNQYGGRMSALFNPINIPTLNAMTGTGPNAITPGTSRGWLQKELGIELDTTKQRLESFINSLQRFGASIGASGIFTGFRILLGGFVATLDGLRPLINAFDSLGKSTKEVLSALVELRLAMLFVSRTRIGGSIPGVNRLPGFRPSEATQARGDLLVGNRQVVEGYQREAIKAQTQVNETQAQINALEAERAEIEAAGVKVGQLTKAQLERQVVLGVQMSGLQGRLATEEGLAARQMALLTRSQQTQKALSTSNRANRMDDATVIAMRQRASVDTVGSEVESAPRVNLATYANQQFVRARTRAAATMRLVAASDREVGAASNAYMRATMTGTAETMSASAALAGSRAAVGGLLTSMRGMIAAIDPLFAAMILLPLAYSEIKSHIDSANQAHAKQIGASTATYTSIQALQAAAAQQGRLANSSYTGGNVLHDLNPFRESEASFSARQGAASGLVQFSQAVRDARQRTFASPVKQVDFTLIELQNESKADTKAFQQHKITKQEYVRRMTELQRSAAASLDVQTAGSAAKANALMTAAGEKFKTDAALALASAARGMKSFYDALGSLDDKSLKQMGQAQTDRASTYGTSDGGLAKATQVLMTMAVRYRASTDSTQLNALQSQMSHVVTAVTKNATDFADAAKTAQTPGGERGDLNKALGAATGARKSILDWASGAKRKWGYLPGAIKAINEVTALALAQVSSVAQTQESAIQSAIQAAGDYRTSQIAGSSTEADIARAASDLKTLNDKLAQARAAHAGAQTIQPLETEIANKQRDLAKQRMDNADQIAQAQGQLATASITGIGPAADMARARQDLANAQQQLTRDRAEGKGLAVLLGDQAAIDNAMRTIAQTAQSNAQAVHQDLAAYIQSQSDLAQSQTTDPVKQAREQLAADIKTLPTIKRSDYKTQQEYETARNEQQAKINKDKTSVTGALVSQQEATLKFELDTQRISDQQYVDGLKRLLRLKNLSLAQKQQLQSEIFNINKSTAVDLNVGSIKLPTVYEVRKAIAAAHHGKQSIGTAVSATVTQTNHFAITVHKDADIKKVTDAISQALGTNTQGAAQAMGLI